MPDFPSGTVTFLFTDVAGSTRLWQDHPDAAAPALARHFALVRGAVESEEGTVFKIVGDAVCAAFSSAPRAVAAALSAQRALTEEVWGSTGPLRVRMALHSGEALHQDRDYFGPPLNRVARILSVAHGGQVLLSAAAQELARDAMPDGASLLDLGEHRLKDLYRPERIFQLVHPSLHRDFPPLRSLDARPHNLPAQPTPFVGRESEITQVADLLKRDDVRLVTITGPGGVGKTRLSLQVAADVLDAFPDGCWFVDLASIRDPDQLPGAIAGVLGVREEGNRPLAEVLTNHLEERALLLVLDNLEQVTAGASTIADLLAAASRIKVLVTSRVRLALRGEHEVVIDPLPTPDPGHLPPVDQLSQYAAVQLFIQRAEAAKHGFAVSNATAPVIAEICYRLDGLPLAIELAAARIKLFTPEALLKRLESRLPVLTGGARDLPSRQRTLRDAIDWSHDLLQSSEQALFRRLAVFAGGATFEAAEVVANPEGDLDLFEVLPSLVDQSLVRQVEDPDGEPRFVMLQTIREFGLEQLARTGEEVTMQRAYAAYAVTMAEAIAPKLIGPEQTMAYARLDSEYANLRSALSWSLDQGEGEIALRVGAALWRYWMTRGLLSEGRRLLDRALNMDASAAGPEVRATALYGAGALAEGQHDYARSKEAYDASLVLCETQGDRRGMARALAGLGSVAITQGHFDEAETLYAQTQAVATEAGDRWTVMVATLNLGNVALYRNELALATERYEIALRVLREVGDRNGISAALSNLGVIAERR
ncbi:MAG: NB-ARC domain-containing protein, partial [Chloroflexota bacterium]|nr:NB-ARC domain-containing protein [Chloroflexota bacterium]